ncbi:hypothetical protein HanXRQr2_Chr02g0062781 [Helianthus annuus]|uniref:Uncharacterized protein n=1 Tax=Helianthus annuus TaxID=4232 RepID=A0A9K3JNC7_HELAN|nr:hypothetical protein HanXRQr2_Chr02g0062781 [Helianthus annuus]KAJ0951573.1 hypothetical protein HanPSC8_Chr02g0061701 [Helianthus annuus]
MYGLFDLTAPPQSAGIKNSYRLFNIIICLVSPQRMMLIKPSYKLKLTLKPHHLEEIHNETINRIILFLLFLIFFTYTLHVLI